MITLYDQYLICGQRGHSSSSEYEKEIVYPKRRCMFCRTIFWQEQHEADRPLPPAITKLPLPRKTRQIK